MDKLSNKEKREHKAIGGRKRKLHDYVSVVSYVCLGKSVVRGVTKRKQLSGIF